MNPPCTQCGFTSTPSSDVSNVSLRSRIQGDLDEDYNHSGRKSVDAFLSKLRGRVDELDAQISVYQKFLRRITHERDIVSASINSYARRSAPVSKLPSELLGGIFLHLLPADLNIPQACEDVQSLRALVGLICRKWRSVALSTPQLWATIAWRDTCTVTVDHLDSWLLKSGSCPLTIKVPYWGPGERIISLLLSSSRRWERLYINSPSLFSLRDTIEVLDLAALKQVVVTCEQEVPERIDLSFQNAPQLQSATIHTDLRLLPELPWNQLTVLECCEISSDILTLDFMHNLRQCCNLFCLRLLIGQNPFGIIRDVDLEPFAIPHLTDLELETSFDPTLVLNHLILPSLHRICIRRNHRFANLVLRLHDSNPFPAFLPSLTAMLKRSSSQLTHLTLHNFSSSKAEMIEFFASTPFLKEIDFRCGSPDDEQGHDIDELLEVVHIDSIGSDGVPLLPRLESISLMGTLFFEEDKMVQMIESRCDLRLASAGSGRTRLKRVRCICDWFPVDMDYSDSLRVLKAVFGCLRDDGVDITFSHPKFR